MKKTALITGASRGIGAGLAKKLAKDGFRVVINYCSNREKAQAVLDAINKQDNQHKDAGHAIFCADVRNAAAVEDMCNKIGEIDLLINNAGIAQQKLFCDITEQEWDDMFAVHVNGARNTMKCVLPGMIKRGRGEIINISSICSVGFACESHYSAAKAALTAMSRALADEVKSSGVIVRAVELGAVDTDMHRKLMEDYEEMTGLKWDYDLPPITVAQAVEAILKKAQRN